MKRFVTCLIIALLAAAAPARQRVICAAVIRRNWKRYRNRTQQRDLVPWLAGVPG